MGSKVSSRETAAAGGSRANLEKWAHGDFVGSYAIRDLRPVEAEILARYRGAFSGRVLEIGCGAGRLSGHLGEIASSFCGIDISPGMIAYCRETYPELGFEVADMQDLSGWEPGSFDALVAPFNVLDALGVSEREDALEGFRRVLRPGGLFVMSSHNLAFAREVRSPIGKIAQEARSGDVRGLVGAMRRLPRRLINRRRMLPQEECAADHALLNDEAHDYSLLQYYVSRPVQAEQLARHGFELLECLDLDGVPLEGDAQSPGCPELHYVARCSTTPRT